jgi:electron transport complex protein RnfG
MSAPSPTKLAVILTVFATLSAFLLAVGDLQTRPQIELRMAEDLKAILSQVVPKSLHQNDLTQDTLTLKGPTDTTITLYRALSHDEVVAIALPVTGQGYAGEIKLVMGVLATGEVLGVRVLSHAETPGLGDKIEAQKAEWILGFSGLSFAALTPEQWKVKKDGGAFDQFSGATITPRAVVGAVKQGLEFVTANHDVLFAKGTVP